MVTIYFNEVPLQILNKEEQPFFNSCSLEELKEILEQPPHTLISKTSIQAPLDDVLEVIQCTHKLICAAGGLVYNEEGALLMIYRRGYWDLPKGKIEEGEATAAAAMREVEEETGVHSLRIEGHVSDTYHTYFMYENYVLKKTYWYKMATDFKDTLIAQTEEDISEVRWVLPKDLPGLLQKTYPNIRAVLGRVL